jgi:hypothetical protein
MYEVIAREEPYADLEPVQVAAQVNHRVVFARV